MAKKGAKKTTRKVKKRPTKKTAKKKKVAKKKAAKKKVAKKRVAQKKATQKKKKAARKKPAKKKATRKKAAKKKRAKRRGQKSAAAIGAQLDLRIDQLTEQLADVRRYVDKQLSKQLSGHLAEIREYADKELATQRKNFDEILGMAKKEQDEIRTKLGDFIEEHHTLKDITNNITETAKELEERVKKAVARFTDPDAYRQ